MRRPRTWVAVAGIVSIVLALSIGGVWAWGLYTARETTVVVAAVEIPPNTVLTAEMVRTGAVPAVEHHYAGSPAEVIGRVTLGHLAPGQPIDERGLIEVQLPAGARLLTTGEIWPPGYALVTVPGDPLETTVGGVIRPGDRVQVSVWRDLLAGAASAGLTATAPITLPLVPAAASPTGSPGTWVPGRVYTVADIRNAEGLSQGLAQAAATGKYVLLLVPQEEVTGIQGLPVRLIPVLEEGEP